MRASFSSSLAPLIVLLGLSAAAAARGGTRSAAAAAAAAASNDSPRRFGGSRATTAVAFVGARVGARSVTVAARKCRRQRQQQRRQRQRNCQELLLQTMMPIPAPLLPPLRSASFGLERDLLPLREGETGSAPEPDVPEPAGAATPAAAAAKEEEDGHAEPSSAPSAGRCGVYVHLPFCRRRCRYCSFAVVPVGGGGAKGSSRGGNGSGGRDDLMEQYTDAVVREIRQQALQQHRSHNSSSGSGSAAPAAITSLYLGGGTPSLLPVRLLRRVVDAVRDSFEVRPGAEFTIEMDPGTFDAAYLEDVVHMGCNRVSLGIQALNDTVLLHLGRQHTAHDAAAALDVVRDHAAAHSRRQRSNSQAAALSYSVDLISSVPGISLAEWCHTLHTVVDKWAPPHISVYDLQIEKGTVFGTWYGGTAAEEASAAAATSSSSSPPPPPPQRLSLPTEDESAFMYRYASAYLRARGYEHYEVSSFARRERTMATGSSSPPPPSPSPHRSGHNQVYWDPDGSWYGFGMGATSHLQGQSVARPRTLHEYFQWVADGGGGASHDDAKEEDDGDAIAGAASDRCQAANAVNASAAFDSCQNVVLKRLRTADGLDLDRDVADRYGERYAGAVLKGAALGLELGLATLDPGSRILRLTVPDGFLLSNSIMSSIFAALDVVWEGEPGSDRR